MVFFLYLLDSVIARKRELIYPEDFEENLGDLSHDWLVLLWNLKKKVKVKGVLASQREKDKAHQPRLVVITKMQRPFEECKAFWTSFRDDPEYIYGILKKTAKKSNEKKSK